MADSDKSSQSPESPCSPNCSAGDTGSQASADKNDHQQDPSDDGRSADMLVRNEPAESRKARLCRIREDLRNGRYDEDEFLQQALKNLLKHISSNTE